MTTSGGLIGALRVTLGLDSAKFEEGTKRARKTADTTSKDIQKKLNGISTTLKAIGIGALGRELAQAGKRALDYAAGLGTMSRQLGVTAEELQVYRYAASQVGVSQDQMESALKKLTQTIGEAHAGTKAQAELFRELGVSVEDSQKRVVSAGVVLPRLADALSKIKDPASRARYEVKLFGEAGQALDPLLSQGSAAIDNMRSAAHELGIVMDDAMIAKAVEAQKKMAALRQVLDTKFATMIAQNADAINTLADALGRAADMAGKAIQGFVRYRAEVGIRQNQHIVDGWFTSPEQKAAAQQNIKRLRDLVVANGGSVSDPEYLRNKAIEDARALFGYTPPVDPGVGGLPTVKEKPKKSRGPTDADRLRNYTEESVALASRLLDLRIQLAAEADERQTLERERLKVAELAYHAELDDQVRRGQLSASAAEKLKLQHQEVNQLEGAIINRELDRELDRQALEAKQSVLQNESDLLRSRVGLARTAEDRRAAELRLLDIQYQLERNELEAVIASKEASDASKKLAQARLDMLGELQAAEAERARRGTAGPMESYLDSIPKTIGEVREQLEQLRVNQLRRVEDGFANIAAKVLGVNGALGETLSVLLRIVAQQAILGAQNGGGVGGFFNGLLSGVGMIFGAGGGGGAQAGQWAMGAGGLNMISPPKLARGGNGIFGGISGIDRNVLSFNGQPMAKVSKGEHWSITPANDRGGRGDTKIFNINGVMTTDEFWAEIERRDAGATIGGAALARANAARAAARGLGGRR